MLLTFRSHLYFFHIPNYHFVLITTQRCQQLTVNQRETSLILALFREITMSYGRDDDRQISHEVKILSNKDLYMTYHFFSYTSQSVLYIFNGLFFWKSIHLLWKIYYIYVYKRVKSSLCNQSMLQCTTKGVYMYVLVLFVVHNIC